jgi:hypothetical protein
MELVDAKVDVGTRRPQSDSQTGEIATPDRVSGWHTLIAVRLSRWMPTSRVPVPTAIHLWTEGQAKRVGLRSSASARRPMEANVSHACSHGAGPPGSVWTPISGSPSFGPVHPASATEAARITTAQQSVVRVVTIVGVVSHHGDAAGVQLDAVTTTRSRGMGMRLATQAGGSDE